MNINHIIFDRLANPRNIALTSLGLVPLLLLLRLILPVNLTMHEAEIWSTVLIVASLTYLITSSILVHRSTVHTYVFFIACTSLFIGGRFLAYAMGFDLSALKMESNFFSVHRPDFITINLDANEGLNLSIYIVTCLHALHSGYMLSIWKQKKDMTVRAIDFEWAKTLRIPAITLAIISSLAFLVSFPEVYRSVHSDGYISLYKAASSDFTTRGSTAAQYGLLLALGLAFASGTRWIGWCVLGLLALYYTAYLQLGVRGGIMGFALLCIWLFHIKIKRIDRLALVGTPIVLAFPVMFAAFGPRAGNFGENTSLYLPWFIDNQGLTALYIHSAMQIDSYPPLAYLHSVFPAIPTIAALMGTTIPLDQLYFGQLLSKTALSGDAYQQGFGMGWSVFADFYAYTLWIPGLYLIAAASFGAALAKLANSTNPIVFGAHVMIFVKIMLLPRTGLYSVIPFLLAYLAIVSTCYLANYLMQRKQETSKK
ncbi:O-antigen polysaccharide polymerase Wzy [Pseudomonas chlororaphis subsp. aurantiaca]|uniref:O-antigen polysaccharide polymerase Wzy n=1 Tax=Pseudomonas chlororaphis TaxID=587753 RepID=UPI0027DD91B0|nr:O-antigen polysaccharide polymerase Wzy [Pseudomonas chlororaphis]WMI98293.1 O-antigen polysaccharide polymerase Wzy [Pseudomonas chlororaphis subsp. aurantiaca]